MTNPLLEFAEKHYREDIVSIHPENIEALRALPRPRKTKHVFDKVENPIKYIFYKNALNFRFWIKNENGLHTWGAHGRVDSPAMVAGLDMFYSHCTDFDKCFPNIPDRETRLGHLYELRFGNSHFDWNLDDQSNLYRRLFAKSHYGIDDALLIAETFPIAFGQDPFLKRAQLCLFDMAVFFENNCLGTDLTIASDYQIPRVLRHFGVLGYSAELAAKVDGLELLESGDEEELAIRSATVLAGQMVAEHFGWAIQSVDFWLWSGRDICTNPHHLTITSDY